MTIYYSKPCGADGNWQTPAHFVFPSPILADWLQHPGSLTARLRGHCQQFTIKVLFEGYSDIAAHEKLALDSAGPYWVREVLLCCDGVAWVFARSVVPQSSLEGDAAAVGDLADKPLGELLFRGQGQRQSIELCQIDPASAIYQYVEDARPLWGRRSRFLLNNAPLLVAEIFLPNCAAYEGDPSVTAS